MASRNTYECYVCKKNNFPGVRVYLDGKTDDGITVYKNEDMTPHQHKQQVKPQQQQVSTTVVTEPTSLNIINAKLDRIITLLLRVATSEEQQQQQQQMADKEKDAEEINALIRQVEGDTARYLTDVLMAIVEEQVKARTLDKQTGSLHSRSGQRFSTSEGLVGLNNE